MSSRTKVFQLLTSGAKFDKGRFRRDVEVFHEKNSEAPNAQSVNTADTLMSVRPAVSLDFFATGDAEEEAPGDNTAQTMGEKNIDVVQVVAPPIPTSRRMCDKIRREHQIRIISRDGVTPPPLLLRFADLPVSIPRRFVTNLARRGIVECTPVQMQVIPLLMTKTSGLVCAPTGSGKTVAYLLPILAKLSVEQPSDDAVGLRAAIVVPTRELAVQVERELHFLADSLRFQIMRVDKNKAQAKKQDVMVTTPGRLSEMHSGGKLDLATVLFLVLDETDKLFDPTTNYVAQLEEIFSALKHPDRVVAMFSATVPQAVDQAASRFLPTPSIRVIIGSRVASTTSVTQRLMFVGDERGKVAATRNLIEDGLMPPVLVFVQSVERCEEVFREVGSAHLRVSTMHAGLSNEERSQVVENFRIGNIWVLITTELMARGMDFKNVGTVINFDFPRTPESYVHRVGRAGRAGQKGVAVTFFTVDDKEMLRDIAEIVKRSGGHVEDWMLQLKRPGRKRRKELRNSTPHRKPVSSRAPKEDD